MEFDKTEDFKEFMWQIGNFLRDKGKNYLPDVVCAATVAAWSLQYDKSEITSLTKSFVNDNTKKAVKDYAAYYTDLQVLAAHYGKEALEDGLRQLDDFPLTNAANSPTYDNGISITDLVMRLHNLSEDDIYVEYGCGSGNSLLTAAQKSTVYGVDINTAAIIMADIKAYWKNISIKIDCADMEENGICNINATKSTVDAGFTKNSQNFEALLSNKYLQPYKSILKRAGVRTWAQALIAYHKNTDGRVIAITTPAALANNADKEIRKNLVNQGIIEGIIELPANILPYTSVAPVLIILSKNNRDGIKIMDATKFKINKFQTPSLDPIYRDEIIKMYDSGKGKCKVVTAAEIAKNDYVLSANRYTEEKAIKNGVSLAEVCYIERGATIKAEDLENLKSKSDTNYKYLMLQNISDGKITTELPSIKEIDPKYKDAILSDNDIVLSKMTPFKICLVHVDKDQQILANGNLFILRVDPDKMNPVYVTLFLSSEKGHQELLKYVKGSAMRTISIKDLKLVQIPMIERAEQNKIADKYTSLMKRLNEIDEERKQVISDISDLI